MNVEPHRLAIFNNKGGVGKSTIAVHIAYGLACKGERVLLMDMDEQNDASLFLGFTSEDYKKTLYDFLFENENTTLKDCIIKARRNLDLLPSKRISYINERLYQEENLFLFLKNKFKDIDFKEYSYVIIDCGPQRSKNNDAVLYYVDRIIVPVQVEAASVRALGNIYEYLYDLGLSADKILQIVPNMFDKRTSDGKENLEFIKEFIDDSDIVADPIYRRIKIAEAGKFGKTVYEYDNTAVDQFEQLLQRLVFIIDKKK